MNYKPFSHAMFGIAQKAFPDTWKSLILVIETNGTRALLCADGTMDAYFCIDYGVQTVPVKTLTGVVQRPMYSIHYPQWEKGDDSVGMPGCYFLDEDELGDPQEIAPNWEECLIQIMQWMLREELIPALRDAGEYESFTTFKEEENV
jgi:hypothetical protein